jgi:PAS domain S-box-containing protein
MVRRVLSEAGRDDLVEPAQLLVSEVVTNALVHSGTSIDVAMSADEQGVLVEVGDGSRHVPRPRAYATTASTGRGLALLEQTADDWGVVPGIRGKTVWFVLSADIAQAQVVEAAEPEPGEGAVVALPTATRPTATLPTATLPTAALPVAARGEPAAPGDGTVAVELLNVPLLLHAAWQQHAEAVLREHLLAHMNTAAAVDPFAEHAMAIDALLLLAEHIPAADVGGDLDGLMTYAVDPRVSMPKVELAVPRDSVHHFEILDVTMDAAQTMANSGQLLVPVVQPEVRMMRQWLCHQVLGQAAGGDPVAWPPSDVLTAPTQRPLAWDTHTVTESAVATIAADDTDLIVAVSAGALRLLGYERADELLGQRLVTIIPQRYRQAHLAGFTLHLLTGRGPLMTRQVDVPVLRRDGSERVVRLGVEARHVASGRSVFVATMLDGE